MHLLCNFCSAIARNGASIHLTPLQLCRVANAHSACVVLCCQHRFAGALAIGRCSIDDCASSLASSLYKLLCHLQGAEALFMNTLCSNGRGNASLFLVRAFVRAGGNLHLYWHKRLGAFVRSDARCCTSAGDDDGLRVADVHRCAAGWKENEGCAARRGPTNSQEQWTDVSELKQHTGRRFCPKCHPLGHRRREQNARRRQSLQLTSARGGTRALHAGPSWQGMGCPPGARARPPLPQRRSGSAA